MEERHLRVCEGLILGCGVVFGLGVGMALKDATRPAPNQVIVYSQENRPSVMRIYNSGARAVDWKVENKKRKIH